ncbi:transposase [Sphingobium yanoikuyae]|uniref:transposase n=1 Tax=Sphingobium yanoikuyae TaxID=13690 RepID=UPI0032E3AB34
MSGAASPRVARRSRVSTEFLEAGNTCVAWGWPLARPMEYDPRSLICKRSRSPHLAGVKCSPASVRPYQDAAAAITMPCDDAGTSKVQQFEVFTGAGQRRDWLDEVKAAIIAESYSKQETVCAVARRHGLSD